MDSKTLEALEGSIKKWEGIVAGTEVDNGRRNCPLCALFWEDNCDGCPVETATGQLFCEGSPYEEWADMQTKQPYPSEIFSEESRQAAERMLSFLKSLRDQPIE